MEIITRQQAITNHLSKYFTGIACKRGHAVERYTLNSCCLACLHPRFDEHNSARLTQERNSRILAKLKLLRFKAFVSEWNLEHFIKIVAVFARLREPSLKREDVLTKFKPRHNGDVALHAFKAFPEDIDALIIIAEDLRDDR